jgi:hypothetical protein
MKIKLSAAIMAIMAFPLAMFADSAIYFCEETGSYGAAWGGNMAEVSQSALDNCQSQGGTSCAELVSCEGTGYGAIAVSDNEVIGASCGYNTQKEANKAALESCVQSEGEGCKIKHTWRG